jgi:hypothetical protein
MVGMTIAEQQSYNRYRAMGMSERRARHFAAIAHRTADDVNATRAWSGRQRPLHEIVDAESRSTPPQPSRDQQSAPEQTAGGVTMRLADPWPLQQVAPPQRTRPDSMTGQSNELASDDGGHLYLNDFIGVRMSEHYGRSVYQRSAADALRKVG